MIKYLGSIGTFIRLNDDEDKTYNLLRVFSSSAASELLFSASVNNLSGAVTINTASTSLYINGTSGSVIPNQQWVHFTLSFDNKLWTYDTNDFLIRFGDTASSNFNIQNLYITQASTASYDAAYLHYAFTGAGESIIRINDSASYSINFIDYPEDNFTSASSKVIYQPLKNQNRYLCDVVAVEQLGLSKYLSASTMVNDNLYIDGFNINNGDRILSLTDNQIYQLTSSSQLITVSSSVGDFVKIISGRQYANSFFIKTSSGFINTYSRQKINSIVNIFNTNNT